MSTPSPVQDRKARAYAYLVVVMLTLVYTFNFLDRKVLSILAEPVRRDLHLSDTQLGLLTGFAFAVFYTTLGIPLAWLADRARRVWIIAAACTVWSLFTAACGLAGGFVQLALFRVGVAAGEAGAGPPSFSIISDYFPPERRGKALAIYALGVPFGVIIGSTLGGMVAAIWGWRMAFLAVGAPGVLISLLVLLVVREPRRGAMDAVAAGQPPHAPPLPMAGSIALFFRNPTLLLTAAASAGSSLVGNGLISWAPAYLMRSKGMHLTDIALYYGAATGVAGAIGTFGAGYLVDRLGQRDRRAYALVPGIAHACGIPFFLAFIFAPSWPLALACVSVPFFTNSTYLAPALTVVQNNVPPGQRSISSAILMFLMTMVGLSGGPLIVGMVSDRVRPAFGDKSLAIGLAALAPFAVLTVVAYAAAAASMRLRGQMAEGPRQPSRA